MKTILTVGCKIPGGYGEHVEIISKASLLDGDFVLFRPTLTFQWASESYMGKPLFSKSSSFRIQDAIAHWKKELSDVLKAGKTVFLLSASVEQGFVYSGEKQYSGTGRNRVTTDMVHPVSNYDLLPIPTAFVDAEGTSMAPSSGDSLLREYWRQFGDESSYRVYMTGDLQPKPLVTVKGSDRVVGGIFRYKSGGALVALPWIDLGRDEFLTEDTEDSEISEDVEVWTNEAKAWGKKYCDALELLDKAIQGQTSATPAPQWANSEEFRTLKEIALISELNDVETAITNLEERRNELTRKARDAGSLKSLLYEQGIPLEHAVLEAMRLMGFEANSYRDSDSEFDVVLECPEGRCVGEVEGRDSRAIDINKMRQLEVNIHEDFARDEVSVPAKAILFGNGFRLTPPTGRTDEQFTAKCVTAAARNGTALVRTSDLYEVARALADHPDADFATACRRAIFDTKGELVTFPAL